MTRDELAQIAVRLVAEQTARKRVRELLRQQGVKLSYVPPREIAAQAKLLATHPEIIAEARAKAAELGYGRYTIW
jgi:hypothetical protein